MAATLCVGLPNDSRIKRRIAGIKLPLSEMYMALIVDGINTLIWQRTKDGMKGRNRPESLFKRLTEDKKPKDELQSFKDIESYQKWYQAKMRKYNG